VANEPNEPLDGPVEAQHLSKARFLTVQEVADLLRVSSMTVYRLIKAGDLPAVRVGRSFRVSDRDVDAYLASRYTQAG
jgi:excisionase family DNA binding protein